MGVVAQGVAGRERGERVVGGPAGVVEGLGQRVGSGGGGPVAGQLADACSGPVAAQRFERLGDLAVGAGLAGAAQLGVQGVLDEGVHEAVVARRVGAARGPAPTRAAASRTSSTSSSVLPAAAGEQVEVEVAADHRGQRQHPFGVPAQAPTRPPITACTLGGNGISSIGTWPIQRPIGVAGQRAGLDEVTQHLTDEERVAAGLAVHLAGERDTASRRAPGRRRPP